MTVAVEILRTVFVAQTIGIVLGLGADYLFANMEPSTGWRVMLSCGLPAPILLVVVTLPLSLVLVVKVVQEFERAVIFRLGRLLTGGARGPGVFFVVPCVDR